MQCHHLDAYASAETRLLRPLDEERNRSNAIAKQMKARLHTREGFPVMKGNIHELNGSLRWPCHPHHPDVLGGGQLGKPDTHEPH